MTWPSIKQPSLNWEATLGPANLAHVYPISSFKISQPQYNRSLSSSKTFQESPVLTLVVETWEYVILSPSLTMVTYFYVILKYLNSQFDTWLNLDTFDQGNKHVLVMKRFFGVYASRICMTAPSCLPPVPGELLHAWNGGCCMAPMIQAPLR